MNVDYIDHMGTDLTVVNAARVSFNKESDWVTRSYASDVFDGKKKFVSGNGLKKEDEKLIKYLANHNHWTPFSHCQITLREKVPIFVARQRFKHMVGFTYNEVSRRYVDDDPEFYVPEAWRSRPDGSVKQGSGNDNIEVCRNFVDYTDINSKASIHHVYMRVIHNAMSTYLELLDSGVAPEQARMVLPQSMYTECYTTGSLAAWARAYKLRIDTHAQKEIQDLAKMWDEIIRPLFPVSWSALVD